MNGIPEKVISLVILIWRLGMRFLTARYAVRLTQSHLKSLIRNIRNGESKGAKVLQRYHYEVKRSLMRLAGL